MEIALGVFVAGLVLWWIIRSDIKEMLFKERMRVENAKRDVAIEADRREADEIRRSGAMFALRRVRHLKLCQGECRNAQNADGLVSIADVARILNWHPYEMRKGITAYNFEGMVCGPGAAESAECYAAGNDEHPFPNRASEGFYRASEVIAWVEEELQENRKSGA